MSAMLKNVKVDVIFVIWGVVFAIQGIIIFSYTPVFGVLLCVAGIVFSLIGGISYISARYGSEKL